MPVFRTKKEAFEWLMSGQKRVDIRRGIPRRGDIAVYLSGRKVLRLKILTKETGSLMEVLRVDNYKLVIPSALTLDDAVAYLHRLYADCSGIFTAYHITSLVP